MRTFTINGITIEMTDSDIICADGILDFGALGYYVSGHGHDLTNMEVELEARGLNERHPDSFIELETEEIAIWICEWINETI